MASDALVRPRLSVLTDAQKRRIHAESLKILSEVGVRIGSAAARRILSRHAGTKAAGDEPVHLTADVVENAIQMAPSSIDIYTRTGERAFRLPGATRFGIGGTGLWFQDPDTDEPVPFNREHTRRIVRLGDRLTAFDAVTTTGTIQNIPPDTADLYGTLELTANTVKPTVLLVSGDTAMPATLDLLESLHGDLAAKPFVIPFLNPVTPLIINQGTADKMTAAIDRGLPIIYATAGIAGGTAPITPAGGLTLMNAELLAGLVLSQSLREGTSVILGGLPHFMDMRGGVTASDPMRFLMNLACAEMMAHYGVPYFGTSGGKTGWGADLVSGGYEWFNHLVSCMGKVSLASFVGAGFTGMTFTPHLVVYASEVIEQARRFAKGFLLDESTIGFDDIAAAGPGGNFIDSDMTFRLFRDQFHRSFIFPQYSLEEWQANGRPRAEETLRRHTRELMDNLVPPPDCEDLLERGEMHIRR